MKKVFKIAWVVALFACAAGACLADELPPALRDTALRRRTRFVKIADLEKTGVLGEGKDGLLALRGASRADLKPFVEEENKDREFTYSEVAKLDKTTVDEARHTFALRFRNQAPIGTPVQDDDGRWSNR